MLLCPVSMSSFGVLEMPERAREHTQHLGLYFKKKLKGDITDFKLCLFESILFADGVDVGKVKMFSSLSPQTIEF